MKSFVSHSRIELFLTLLVAILLGPNLVQGQDPVVDFARDIKPILEARCLQCHGEDLAEADLSFADQLSAMDYLEPGDSASSTIYSVLVDPDMLMPPEDEGGPLPAHEIALIKLWIDEGATWPEDVVVGSAEPRPAETETAIQPQAPKVPPSERPLPEKIWAFHGYFHPAVVHFPIALLTISALFVLLHWVLRGNYREFAFYLLMLGAISSVVACTMGWAFAPERSMGGGIFDMENKVFNHRWLGIGVAVLTSVLTIAALRARKSEKRMVQFLWQAGILVAAGLVGIVGHQGGELVYGEGIYDKAFAKYFSEPASEQQSGTTDIPTAGGESDSDATTGDEATTEDTADKASDADTDVDSEKTDSESETSTDEGAGDGSDDTTTDGNSETVDDTNSETATVRPPGNSESDNQQTDNQSDDTTRGGGEGDDDGESKS